MDILDKDGNPMVRPGGGANQVRVGIVPDQGLILIQVGGGQPVGVDPASAVRLAHGLLSKALGLIDGIPEEPSEFGLS